MAIFAHVCEMFVEVMPSVELFRYFFVLCRTSLASSAPGVPAQRQTVGGCCFCMRSSSRAEFVSFTSCEKWEQWERKWLYVEPPAASPRLALHLRPPPEGLAAPMLDQRWQPVLDRFADLRARGLTSAMVALDFFRRRLAPLQARVCPRLNVHRR